MPDIPVATRTRSRSTGRGRSTGFQTLQPGSAATTSLLPATDIMADPQDRLHDDEEESTPIEHLFPSFDQPLATFLHDIFDIPKERNDALCEALIAARIKTWLAFLYIENIGDLVFLEGGVRTPIYRHVQTSIQQVIDYGEHLTARGLDPEDRTQYTKDNFQSYCFSAHWHASTTTGKILQAHRTA
eukprot:jgi/Psemu1/55957/gm1.55957_g